MNDERIALKFLIPADVAPPAPQPLTPGQEIMRSQRADRKRLVPLQHAGGKPIRVRRPTTREERRALAKHIKKLRWAPPPRVEPIPAGTTSPSPQPHLPQ